MEQVRLEQECQEKEMMEKECQEKERLEQQHQEKERLEQEHQEKERLEQECQEKERMEQQRQEKERMGQVRLEQEHQEKEHQENERMEQDVIMADDAHENDQHMHVNEYHPPAMAHSSSPGHELEPADDALMTIKNGLIMPYLLPAIDPHPIGTICIIDLYLPLIIAAHADHALRLDTNCLRATRVLEGVTHPPPLICPHHAITFKEQVLQLTHRATLLRLPNSRLLL
ncbi:uncharacterized protein EDB91DRAFT_1253628 [Suillus paluster]|uniref:uncharacterized protein n=1 Tax=Suillus paluster TaxID=48578 RepID=UPI001B87E474|nr:uncharacterized protein EDB91DRAFT_1253628 [Suillus paluster]KAG1728040.1 hypothetical protein EDB91DRAFT_1253628 [Suillus paluster]